MSSIDLDFRDRAAKFAALEAERFDVLVIGGGVTGAGVARDAAMRGMSVALIEARDFASGTSSRSSKLVHGGLRYLAQGDVGLVKEAASERQTLRRIAPHLTRLTPFVMPAHNFAASAKLRAAVFAFEKLGGVPSEESHEVWNAAELASREPLVRTKGLHGAVVYSEFLTDDARLVLANVRSAQGAGAVVLNYAEATEIVEEGGVATGVVCRSTAPGVEASARIRAKLIVNAAGPWVDRVRGMEQGGAAPKLTLTKGVHVVVDRARLPLQRTVIMRASDKRGLFAVPRGEFTYLGTTDTFYEGPDYWPKVEASDIDYIFKATGETLDTAPLTEADIVSIWSGVRPLISQAGKKASEISRKDEVWTGPGGVITIAGGKLSAYRAMAERIVDQAVEALDAKAQPCRTAETFLPGGASDPREVEATLERSGLNIASAERLVGLYGDEAPAVVQAGGDVAAEARRAVLQEGAATLEDYWVRRSARAWFDHGAGLHALAPAAEVMGDLLGWSEGVKAAQIEACRTIDRNSRPALRPVLQEAVA